MAIPVVIPNTFANATASIPLSQLDANFNALANVFVDLNSGAQQLANANVATIVVNSNNISADNSLGFRNRIINGDMRIDQRNAGTAVTVNTDAIDLFSTDRFYGSGVASDGVFTLQQSTTAPTGFNYSVKATVTTTDASILSTERYFFAQKIEGYNVADLGWGAAGAKTVTLSFWVQSSLTGTFGGSLRNDAVDRSYPFTYTISAANTWEYKTVTITGDTSGTWLKTNGAGLLITWSLGAGSSRVGTAGAWATANYFSATGETALIGTLNATWYITGVQLEVGSVATPFERRPYGTELALCQRYFTRLETSNFTAQPCWAYAANNGATRVPLPTVMRAAPTMTIAGTIGDNTDDWAVFNNGAYRPMTDLIVENSNPTSFRINVEVSSGISASDAFGLYAANADGGASLTASAEL